MYKRIRRQTLDFTVVFIASLTAVNFFLRSVSTETRGAQYEQFEEHSKHLDMQSVLVSMLSYIRSGLLDFSSLFSLRTANITVLPEPERSCCELV